MNTTEWLKQNVLEFAGLTEQEHLAIYHFLILWSLFEAKLQNNEASPTNLLRMVRKWKDSGHLDVGVYKESLEHFRSRYFNNGHQTDHFNGLFRINIENILIRKVEKSLRDVNSSPEDSVEALFLVVYRLRNNLFHGIKWTNEIKDQIENFKVANIALMHALDTPSD